MYRYNTANIQYEESIQFNSWLTCVLKEKKNRILKKFSPAEMNRSWSTKPSADFFTLRRPVVRRKLSRKMRRGSLWQITQVAIATPTQKLAVYLAPHDDNEETWKRMNDDTFIIFLMSIWPDAIDREARISPRVTDAMPVVPRFVFREQVPHAGRRGYSPLPSHTSLQLGRTGC
jgi:hypothetical protein